MTRHANAHRTVPQMPVVHRKGAKEEELKIFFRRYDRNGDGFLDKTELKEAFQRLGVMIPSWRASRSLLYADTNKDGRVSDEEMDKLIKYAISHGYTVREVGCFPHKF